MNIDVIIQRLSEIEKEEIKNKNITDIESLIPILLRRISSDNISNLSELLKKSVLPSICQEIDNEIEKLFKEIDTNPKILFNKDIQKKIASFIAQRFERDKNVVIKKTSDISRVVTLMSKYLNDAISSSGSGSENILDIKEKIQAIDIKADGVESLTKFQKELVIAASSIEEEMNQVSNKLQTGKTQVQELEEKVKNLESELSKTKDESRRDHLTGLLTRRAYAEEMKRIESTFIRNNTQYAVVFFDLDYFKKVNDTYGHKCGDVVLSTFAKILSKNTRDHDIVVRYGGEEFVSIVHYNLDRELLQYLKRIKAIVTENSFVYQKQHIKMTFSAGVANRGDNQSYDATIQKADMLLYEAKENGRNQIKLEDGRTI